MTEPAASLSPAQRYAYAKLQADGVIYAHGGVTRATALALVGAGLADWHHRPSTVQYGTLGVGSGYRGRRVQNWFIRIKTTS
jgi:hypothetical protein